jgi:hypothetical protein
MAFFGGGGASGNVALPIDEFIPSAAKVQSGRFNYYGLGTITTKNHASGYILWTAVYVPETKNYTNAYIWVTNAAASSEVKLGFYEISSGGLPSNKLLETGGIATTSTGLKSISFTATSFNKGWVIVAVASNGGASFNAMAGGAMWGYFSGFNGSQFTSFSLHTYANALPNPWSGTITESGDNTILVGLT